MRSFSLFCIIFALLTPSLCLARDAAVITHKANPTSTVSKDELLKLLKLEMPRWSDGKKVIVFLSNPASEDGRLFREKTYKMTAAELKAFAATQKGGIVILASDELVVKAVAEYPGSIGVVNVYSISSAVKVLRVDGKLPFEQGYLLHGN
jgi:ABC-type phosphate transport system substrate-binding protein